MLPYCFIFPSGQEYSVRFFLKSALSVFGVRRESSPNSLKGIGFTALTKIPASE